MTLPRGEHLPEPEQKLVRDLCAYVAPALAAWSLARAHTRADVGELLDAARLDAIAAELKALDDLDPEQRAAALERIDREVAELLDGVRALARELTP